MTTPFDIFGVVSETASKVVAALYLPSGKVTGTGTTIAGGTVSGTTTIAPGTTVIYMGLSESPAFVFGASASIAGTALPDSTDRPYTTESRVVDPATDMTDASAIAAAFEASSTVVDSRGVRDTLSGGMLSGGVWGSVASGRSVDGVSRQDYEEVLLAFALNPSAVTDNGDGTATLIFKKRDGSTGKFTQTFSKQTGARSTGVIL